MTESLTTGPAQGFASGMSDPAAGANPRMVTVDSGPCRWRTVGTVARMLRRVASHPHPRRPPGLTPATRLPTAVPDTEAADVLQQAALMAKRLPSQSVSLDQFVFVEQVRQDSSEQLNANGVNIWT